MTEHNTTSRFIELVKPLLGHRGSIKRAAEAVGITPEHMSRVLHGRSMVSEGTLARAEKRLGVSAGMRETVDELTREILFAELALRTLQLKLMTRKLEASEGGNHD